MRRRARIRSPFRNASPRFTRPRVSRWYGYLRALRRTLLRLVLALVAHGSSRPLSDDTLTRREPDTAYFSREAVPDPAGSMSNYKGGRRDPHGSPRGRGVAHRRHVRRRHHRRPLPRDERL